MSQMEKKAGLLRRTSSSKKPLKEKVVLMYDEIFAVSITAGGIQWWKVNRNKIELKCKQSPVCFFFYHLERRPGQKQPSLLGWAVSYEGKVEEKSTWRRQILCWVEKVSLCRLYQQWYWDTWIKLVTVFRIKYCICIFNLQCIRVKTQSRKTEIIICIGGPCSEVFLNLKPTFGFFKTLIILTYLWLEIAHCMSRKRK